MPYTLEEIEANWLSGSGVALGANSLVDAFNRVERAFGRPWIESSRSAPGGVSRGTSPTLRIATLGQQLVALDGVDRSEGLLESIRRGESSAEAELTAIFLIRLNRPAVQVELSPTVTAKNTVRRADLRVRRPDELWTYVEVTQTDFSEAHNRITTVLDQVASLLETIKKSLALEVFLRREPHDHELQTLATCIAEISQLEAATRKELPDDLGFLLLNHSRPGEAVISQHPGEDDQPRVGVAKAIVGPNEPHRHMIVRIAFSDERAEELLRKESRQLPTDGPGLVMAQISRATGAMRTWEKTFRRRLQPSLHTRVSAVCMFGSGLNPTARGEAWIPETKVILNPYCKAPIPTWLSDALRDVPSEVEAATAG